MKKKFVLLFAAILFGFTIMFVSVGCGNQNMDNNFAEILQTYAKVSTAQKTTKTIQVLKDDIVLNSIEEIYLLTGDEYTLTKKTVTLNAIGEGSGMYEETTSLPQTLKKDEVSFGSLLEASCYEDIDYSLSDNGISMIAKIKKESFARLNLTADKVQGDITIKISVEDKKFVSMSYEYDSSNGNNVIIAYQYSY